MGTESEQRVDPEQWSDGVAPLLPYIALAGVLISLGTILLATVISPSFRWQTHALSNLGVTSTDPGTPETVLLFNGGLVAGGLVGATFCAFGYRQFERRWNRRVAAIAGTALLLMGLIGVFPQDTSPHFPIAITFFLLVSVTMWVDGLVNLRTGNRRVGGLLFAGGTANFLAWIGWITLKSNPLDGVAIPEMFGALLFGAWLSVFAVRLADSL